MRPDLGEVERVVGLLARFQLRHDLDLDLPFREVAALDRLEQVALRAFAVVADHLVGLCVRPVLVALQRLEVELHPVALAGVVPQAVGVAAVAVHKTVAPGQAAIGEQDRYLMQALGRERPEIPHRGRRPHVGLRMAFLRADEIREFHGIADEEDRRVVADQIPVAFLGVELEREAAHVPLGVGRPMLARNGREAQQRLRLGAGLEHLGPRVFRDVAGDGQRAVGRGSLRMDHALGDPLAVLVRELLEQLIVLQQDRTFRASRDAVLIVRNRSAGGGRECRAFSHASPP
jgi:hypothetical protein